MNEKSKFVLLKYKIKKYLGYKYDVDNMLLPWEPSYRSTKYSYFLRIYNKETNTAFCFDYANDLKLYCLFIRGKQYKNKKYLTKYKKEFINICNCIDKATKEMDFKFYELSYDNERNLDIIK